MPEENDSKGQDIRPDDPRLPNIREVMAFLRPYARGAWHWFAFDALLSLLSIGAGLAAPALAAVTIDEAVEGRIGWGFQALAVAMIVSVLIEIVAEPVRARLRAPIERGLTRGMVGHALDLGMPGRRPFDDGDLQNRIRSEASYLPRYPETLLRIGTGFLTGAGSLAALFYVHWVFAAVALAGVGAVTVLMHRLMGALTAGQTGLDELNSRMVNAYTGALAGRRTIRAAGTLEREVERITKPLPHVAEKTREILEDFGRGGVLVTSANHVVLTVTAVAGVLLLASGGLTAGALMAAIRYAQMTYASVAGLFDNGWFQIAIFRAYAARVLAVLRAPAAVPEPGRDAPHPEGPGEIRIESVSLGGPQEQVLRRVDLLIPAGKTVALVGRSGVGKTTLAGLIGRLQDPDRGVIRIDGAAVSGLPRDALSRLVGYAFERPALFGDTIRDVITLGAETTDEAVRAAARQVEADAFIERLPKGYDSPLDDAPTSGGEHQRLGLARAAFRDTPILILDDALSSLDVATEARVLAALRRLGRSRTTVVIAHRASTAAAADLVAWLFEGEVRRVAPHAELWQDAAYRAAFQGDPSEEAAE
ncbi:MAG: ABC transporter ATP-binding protein [Gemmatimonadota bacterium]|nr:ABC transporter ATP-binding protein [Gemmatimonadota bacterium]